MITIQKLDHTGAEKISYAGLTLARTENAIVVEAHFSRERMDLGYVTLKTGDRFVEYFYSDRWFNIFEIYDVDDGALKGWYCNITRPAQITHERITAEDLALDYFVNPNRREYVLDEDEFAALPLSPADSAQAAAALDELQKMAANCLPPFEAFKFKRR